MEAIFSSKLYRTSTRKAKIAAALANPINVELVQQLDSYLTTPTEVKDALDDTTNIETPVSDVEVNEPGDTSVDTSEAKFSHENSSSPASSPTSTPDTDTTSTDVPSEADATIPEGDVKHADESKFEKFHAPAKSEESDTDEPANKENETVEESTKIEGATTLYTSSVEDPCCNSLRVDITALKGTLDVREDTHGVSRILVKDNELWIHYQDSVNLNSIMEPVIYVLNAAGFTQFEFNRLARSSNAIVFDILSVPDDVEPITKDE